MNMLAMVTPCAVTMLGETVLRFPAKTPASWTMVGSLVRMLPARTGHAVTMSGMLAARRRCLAARRRRLSWALKKRAGLL